MRLYRHKSLQEYRRVIPERSSGFIGRSAGPWRLLQERAQKASRLSSQHQLASQSQPRATRSIGGGREFQRLANTYLQSQETYLQPLLRRRFVQKLCVQIRAWAGENHGVDRPENIILVGHSLGGLLARDALMSYDDDSSVSQRLILPGVSPWTARVSRVVLLASPNAGYDFHSEPWLCRWLYALASIFGQFMVEQFEIGSPCMTELRLRWYSYMPRSGLDNNASGSSLRLVQVFGDEDRLVSSKVNGVESRLLA
jgi:hypothetical protein